LIDVLYLFDDGKDIMNLRCINKVVNNFILDKTWDHLRYKIKRHLSEEDFITFVTKFKPKILHLNRNIRLTDKAFKHLEGIHTLNMSECYRNTITDKAFKHLKGIHTLGMCLCDQETITDKAFEHLKGIHTLDMRCCKQETITDKAFVYLKGIHKLDIRCCIQTTITDKTFEHLKDTVPEFYY